MKLNDAITITDQLWSWFASRHMEFQISEALTTLTTNGWRWRFPWETISCSALSLLLNNSHDIAQALPKTPRARSKTMLPVPSGSIIVGMVFEVITPDFDGKKERKSLSSSCLSSSLWRFSVVSWMSSRFKASWPGNGTWVVAPSVRAATELFAYHWHCLELLRLQTVWQPW